MNETVSQGPHAVPRAEIELAAEKATGSRGRGRWVALGAVVVLLAGGVWTWRAGVFSPTASPGRGAAPPVATAAVARRDLSAVLPVTATLGYAGSYPVTGQGSGRLTWLPAPGTVVHQGEVLYRVDDGTPVVLLYGRVPAWRALSEGMTGHDVAQPNRDLVRLGHADRADARSPRSRPNRLPQWPAVHQPKVSIRAGSGVADEVADVLAEDVTPIGVR
ncbi:MAG TPA: hypothetical protein VFV01_23850 [Spirillospora sp.]|nr:hypothetical protein [Spirillospora sp.]